MFKNHGFFRVLFELILIVCTGGFWLLYMFVRCLLKKKYYITLIKKNY